MTPPPDPQQGDSILVLLGRMDEKLTNALKALETHATTLDRHDGRLRSVEDRVTTIEASRPKNVVAWAGVGVAALATVGTFLALFFH